MSWKRSLGAVFGLFILASAACATAPVAPDQPNMREAVDALRAARQSLEAAEPNKGGHRERAIQLIDDAIHQTEEGIRFAQEHG